MDAALTHVKRTERERESQIQVSELDDARPTTLQLRPMHVDRQTDSERTTKPKPMTPRSWDIVCFSPAGTMQRAVKSQNRPPTRTDFKKLGTFHF